MSAASTGTSLHGAVVQLLGTVPAERAALLRKAVLHLGGQWAQDFTPTPTIVALTRQSAELWSQAPATAWATHAAAGTCAAAQIVTLPWLATAIHAQGAPVPTAPFAAMGCLPPPLAAAAALPTGEGAWKGGRTARRLPPSPATAQGFTWPPFAPEGAAPALPLALTPSSDYTLPPHLLPTSCVPAPGRHHRPPPL